MEVSGSFEDGMMQVEVTSLAVNTWSLASWTFWNLFSFFNLEN